MIITRTDPFSNPKKKPMNLLNKPKPSMPIIFEAVNPRMAENMNVDTKITTNARNCEI